MYLHTQYVNIGAAARISESHRHCQFHHTIPQSHCLFSHHIAEDPEKSNFAAPATSRTKLKYKCICICIHTHTRIMCIYISIYIYTCKRHSSNNA